MDARTEEEKQYPIHCRKRGSVEGIEEVLLDVNQLAVGKEYMAIGVMRVSDNSRLLLYSTDETGFREYTLRLKDLTTVQKLHLVNQYGCVTDRTQAAKSRVTLFQ